MLRHLPFLSCSLCRACSVERAAGAAEPHSRLCCEGSTGAASEVDPPERHTEAGAEDPSHYLGAPEADHPGGSRSQTGAEAAVGKRAPF